MTQDNQGSAFKPTRRTSEIDFEEGIRRTIASFTDEGSGLIATAHGAA